MCGLNDFLFYSVCYMPLLSFFPPQIDVWPIRALKADFCIFVMFPSFFEHVFTFWPNKVVQVHMLYSFAPPPPPFGSSSDNTRPPIRKTLPSSPCLVSDAPSRLTSMSTPSSPYHEIASAQKPSYPSQAPALCWLSSYTNALLTLTTCANSTSSRGCLPHLSQPLPLCSGPLALPLPASVPTSLSLT